MKPQELRIGNLIFHGDRIITIVGITLDGIEYKLENDEQIYIRNFVDVLLQPIPITEEWANKLGLEKHNGIVASYELKIQSNPFFYKSLSITYNNDNSTKQYYCWFREGGINKDRSEDSLVCIKKNLQYVHQLQNIIFDLTDKDVTLKNKS